MTAVESLESHKQPFHPSHRPCKSRQTSGICTFPPPDDESSLVYRLNAKPNPETINPWVGQNKMPNWTNFSCQRHRRHDAKILSFRFLRIGTARHGNTSRRKCVLELACCPSCLGTPGHWIYWIDHD